MRAIIIDDEAANRENLIHLLLTAAPDVEVISVCGSVDESIIAIKQHQPELLFLDIQLHDQSGFDLLKQVKEINFEVIFITAFDKYGIQAVKFAALDYLLKPIDVEELSRVVQVTRNCGANDASDEGTAASDGMGKLKKRKSKKD